MTWVFKEENATNSDDGLYNTALNDINALTPSEMSSLKVAMSNRNSGNARVLMIYATGVNSIPDITTLGNTWTFKHFSTDGDYNGMYTQLTTFLNDPANGLTDAQTFWSQVSFDNSLTYASNLVVWYRTLPS